MFGFCRSTRACINRAALTHMRISCVIWPQVELKGILHVESHPKRYWRRITFWCEPVGPSPAPTATGSEAPAPPAFKPKAVLDDHLQPTAAPVRRKDATTVEHLKFAALSVRSASGSDCCSPKTLPDWESAGACWVHLHELRQLRLRSSREPCTWFPVLAAGVDKLPTGLQLPDEWVTVFERFPCC